MQYEWRWTEGEEMENYAPTKGHPRYQQIFIKVFLKSASYINSKWHGINAEEELAARISPIGNAKQCSNYRTIALISHASKVMLKFLQPRLQQSPWTSRYSKDLEKAEEPDIKLPTTAGS